MAVAEARIQTCGRLKPIPPSPSPLLLFTNYRSTFSQEVARSGIDGLINTLEDKRRSPSRVRMGCAPGFWRSMILTMPPHTPSPRLLAALHTLPHPTQHPRV